MSSTKRKPAEGIMEMKQKITKLGWIAKTKGKSSYQSNFAKFNPQEVVNCKHFYCKGDKNDITI